MRKLTVFSVLVSFFILTSVAHSLVQVPLYDGEFVRGTGKPIVETVTFPGISGPATIKVFNGAEDGVEKVSSAVISVNGNIVIDSSMFNQKVGSVDAEITLDDGQNELAVELRSKPGGKISIKIFKNFNEILSPFFSPKILISGLTETVTFSVFHNNSETLCEKINLFTLNEEYYPVSFIGTLYDDGLNGDVTEGDGIFTARIPIFENYPKELKLQLISNCSASKPFALKVIDDFQVNDFNINYNENLQNTLNSTLQLVENIKNLASIESTEEFLTLCEEIINNSNLAYFNLKAISDFELSNTPEIIKNYFYGLVSGANTLKNIGEEGGKTLDIVKAFIENGRDPRVQIIVDFYQNNPEALIYCGLRPDNLDRILDSNDFVDKDFRSCLALRFEFLAEKGFVNKVKKEAKKFSVRQVFSPLMDGTGTLISNIYDVGSLGSIIIKESAGSVFGIIIDYFMDDKGNTNLILGEVSDNETLNIPAGEHNILYSPKNGNDRSVAIEININKLSELVIEFFSGDIFNYSEIFDIQDPTVTAFSIENKLVNNEVDSVIAQYTVEDPVALDRVELWRGMDFEGLPVDTSWEEVKRKTVSGTAASDSITDDNPSLGLYWYGIHVFNEAGLEATEPEGMRTRVFIYNNTSDFDDDGMPDWWELLYGFDPYNPADAGLDHDDDGFTNLQEYFDGTHPKDGLSYFLAPPQGLNAQFDPINNWIWITWNPLPGEFTYRLYWGTDSSVNEESEFGGETGDTEFSHTGVLSGWTYYYRLTSVDSNGNESALSELASAYVPFGGVTGRIPDTGQTMCYDENHQEVTCDSIKPGDPYYGQDGHYQPRLPRSYTKLGYGGAELADDALHVDGGGPWIMTRDNVTGLIWEVRDDPNRFRTYSWSDAQDIFIPDLNSAGFEGFSDWRLPEINELSSLVHRGVYGPAIDSAWFPNYGRYFWSSTPFADSNSAAWDMDFYGGRVSFRPDSESKYVRAVRAGKSWRSDNFIDNGDGTITDRNTGLMWQKETAPSTFAWQQALEYAENLTFPANGYTDWRLPNINELQTLLDYSNFGPAIYPIFSSYTMLSRYWSSTTFANSSRGAWRVDFDTGRVGATQKSYWSICYVRAVRNIQLSK